MLAIDTGVEGSATKGFEGGAEGLLRVAGLAVCGIADGLVVAIAAVSGFGGAEVAGLGAVESADTLAETDAESSSSLTSLSLVIPVLCFREGGRKLNSAVSAVPPDKNHNGRNFFDVNGTPR